MGKLNDHFRDRKTPEITNPLGKGQVSRLLGWQLYPSIRNEQLCIKLGRGHWDACVETWDLGTRGEGRGDIKYGTRGRQI